MTKFVAIRAGMTLGGLLVFVIGIRTGSAEIRWAGIGVLGAAFVVRFLDPARRR